MVAIDKDLLVLAVQHLMEHTLQKLDLIVVTSDQPLVSESAFKLPDGITVIGCQMSDINLGQDTRIVISRALPNIGYIPLVSADTTGRIDVQDERGAQEVIAERAMGSLISVDEYMAHVSRLPDIINHIIAGPIVQVHPDIRGTDREEYSLWNSLLSGKMRPGRMPA